MTIDKKLRLTSGVATGVSRGQSAPLDGEKFAKNREKRGRKSEKSGKKREEIGKKEEKSGRFFHFAPPDR